jgi:hypothetical protein
LHQGAWEKLLKNANAAKASIYSANPSLPKLVKRRKRHAI